MSLIDKRKADAYAAGQIEIDASPEVVWGVLTNFKDWPAWNRDVKRVTMSGSPMPGEQFRWKTGLWTIVSTILRMEPPRLVAWKGKMLGINAVHVWQLEGQGGRTLVKTEETWDGLVPSLFRGTAIKMLQDSLDKGLQYLKTEAERRSGDNLAMSA